MLTFCSIASVKLVLRVGGASFFKIIMVTVFFFEAKIQPYYFALFCWWYRKYVEGYFGLLQ